MEVSQSYKGRILSWVHNVYSTWRLLSSHWGEDRMGLGFPIEKRIGWNVEVSKKERSLSWVHNVDSIWRLLSSWGWNGIRISHWDEDRMEWGGLIICEGEDAGDEEQRVWRWLIVCGLLTGWLPLLILRPTHDDDYAKMMMMMVMMTQQLRLSLLAAQ